MKRYRLLTLSLLLAAFLAACGPVESPAGSSGPEPGMPQSRSAPPAPQDAAGESGRADTRPGGGVNAREGGQTMHAVTVRAGEQNFSALLFDNPSAHALLARLPLTIEMDDLNGNEKYYFFAEDLPVDAGQPGEIYAGDLMLYGTDCLVRVTIEAG